MIKRYNIAKLILRKVEKDEIFYGKIPLFSFNKLDRALQLIADTNPEVENPDTHHLAMILSAVMLCANTEKDFEFRSYYESLEKYILLLKGNLDEKSEKN